MRSAPRDIWTRLPADMCYPSLMEYRGKHYIVVQGIEPESWKWTVDLDEHTVKSSGEARARVSAITAAILCIDKALGKPAGPA